MEDTFAIAIGVAANGIIGLMFDGTWLGDGGNTGEMFRLMLRMIRDFR